MPVIKYDDRGRASRSPSLPHEDRSKRTPSPSGAGPSKKPRLTTTDIQKMQIERLLADPEKEVKIPDGPQERQVRAPRDMMKNVTGSSSGAGSGEFHVYKQSRRREYERVKIMEEKSRALEEQAKFIERQAARDAVTNAKTDKNRARRQKRKAGRKGEGGANGAGAPAAHDSHSKLAGGAATVVFKRPGEASDDEDEEEVGPAPSASAPESVVPEAPAVPVAAAVEVAITLHDDD